MNKKLPRKVIAAVIGVVVAITGDRAGIGADALNLAVFTIVSFIGGVALEDGLRGRK